MKRITWKGRAFAFAVVALAVGVVGAAGASATPPTSEDIGVIPYEISVDCSPYGFAFAVDAQGQEKLRIETFYDADGNPVEVVTHDRFTETDTNSATGKALRFSGVLTDTVDLVAGTRTDAGKEFVMTDPGNGIVIQDAGRVVFDAPYHVSFEAGLHEVLHGDIDQLVCTALSG